MNTLLPEGFEVPRESALTLALQDLDSVTIEQGPAFEVEGDREGVKVERSKDGKVFLVTGTGPVARGGAGGRSGVGNFVYAGDGSVACGGDFSGNVVITGDGNTAVQIGGSGGGRPKIKKLWIQTPAPLALVLGQNVRKVRCHVRLTVLHMEGFAGEFTAKARIARLVGVYAGDGPAFTFISHEA